MPVPAPNLYPDFNTLRLSHVCLNVSDLAASRKCSIPDDQIDPRRSGLFMARSILREIRDGGKTC